MFFFPYEDSYALRPRLNNYNNFLNERFSDILLSVGLLRDFMYSCFFFLSFPLPLTFHFLGEENACVINLLPRLSLKIKLFITWRRGRRHAAAVAARIQGYKDAWMPGCLDCGLARCGNARRTLRCRGVAALLSSSKWVGGAYVPWLLMPLRRIFYGSANADRLLR